LRGVVERQRQVVQIGKVPIAYMGVEREIQMESIVQTKGASHSTSSPPYPPPQLHPKYHPFFQLQSMLRSRWQELLCDTGTAADIGS